VRNVSESVPIKDKGEKMITSEKVKNAAKKFGADLVGIASMDRFEGAPKQMDPRYINPDAKALIVIGLRIPRGALRGIEEGTYFLSYSSQAYGSINMIYNPFILYHLTRYIEDYGYEATPIPNDYYDWPAIEYHSGKLKENWSKPVSPEKPAPDVFIHFRIAAFCAGLGEIGYSKIFLTPEFGPRQRFACILTDAPLKPDPLVEPGTICDRCMMCVKECSAGAISTKETIKIKVAGKQLEWGKLDIEACSKGFQGMKPYTRYNPFIGEPSPAILYSRAIEGGRGCIRACMIHLEKQGKTRNRFKEPFRKRKTWQME
jgi:epoxyqueuosine reductase QueG